ncbi:hypothetical protein V6N11_033196 [Hibiscus sabdariffa]|uniref:Uncharacterized protein n=2 Tax=Hibiscus sabdariffa TaxID=183260 RepID=A0ABR2A348_9ROSI
MLAPNGDWLWFRFEHLLPSPALQRIAAIKAPFRSALPDFLGWLPSSDRSFSVRIAYRLHMGFVDDNVDPYWKVIIKLSGSQWVKSFLWLLTDGRILTNVERQRRHLTSNVSTEPILVAACLLVHGYRPAGSLSEGQAVHSRSHGDGRTICGGVIRNSNGDWILGFSKFIGFCSVIEAEIWGIVEGLHHVWRLGLHRVWIELDNANMVRLFERRLLRHGYLSLLHHVDRMLEWDWEVHFSHVFYEANSIADCLAKYGFIVDRGGHVFSHPPDFALNVYLDDCRLLSPYYFWFSWARSV